MNPAAHDTSITLTRNEVAHAPADFHPDTAAWLKEIVSGFNQKAINNLGLDLETIGKKGLSGGSEAADVRAQATQSIPRSPNGASIS